MYLILEDRLLYPQFWKDILLVISFYFYHQYSHIKCNCYSRNYLFFQFVIFTIIYKMSRNIFSYSICNYTFFLPFSCPFSFLSIKIFLMLLIMFPSDFYLFLISLVSFISQIKCLFRCSFLKNANNFIFKTTYTDSYRLRNIIN